MALPFSFSNNTTPTGPQLDADLAALGNISLLPATVSGTNALTLTLLTNVPTVSAYANYMTFTGIAAATNTGATTAQVGSLSALNVYKDTAGGPVVLAGGEIRQNCTFALRYDSALNSGAGGFHLIAQTALAGGTVSQVVNFAGGLQVGSSISTISRLMSNNVSLAWGVVGAQATSQLTVTLTGCAVNDSIAVGPPNSIVPGTHFYGYVPVAGSVILVAANITAGTLTPVSGFYRVTAIGGTP
jgi:hypothetical protein